MGKLFKSQACLVRWYTFSILHAKRQRALNMITSKRGAVCLILNNLVRGENQTSILKVKTEGDSLILNLWRFWIRSYWTCRHFTKINLISFLFLTYKLFFLWNPFFNISTLWYIVSQTNMKKLIRKKHFWRLAATQLEISLRKKKYFPWDRKIFLQNIFRFIYQWDKICIEFTAINQISFYTFIHSFFIPQKVYR